MCSFLTHRSRHTFAVCWSHWVNVNRKPINCCQVFLVFFLVWIKTFDGLTVIMLYLRNINFLLAVQFKGIPKYYISSLKNGNFCYFLFPIASKKSKCDDVIDLIICADLSCLRIFIREKKHRIAEIHIEGRKNTLITKTQNFVTVIVYRFCMSRFLRSG